MQSSGNSVWSIVCIHFISAIIVISIVIIIFPHNQSSHFSFRLKDQPIYHNVQSLVQSSFKLTSLYSLHISLVLAEIDFSLSQKNHVWFYLCHFALIAESSLSAMTYLLLYTCARQTEFRLHKACNKCSLSDFIPSLKFCSTHCLHHSLGILPCIFTYHFMYRSCQPKELVKPLRVDRNHAS